MDEQIPIEQQRVSYWQTAKNAVNSLHMPDESDIGDQIHSHEELISEQKRIIAQLNAQAVEWRVINSIKQMVKWSEDCFDDFTFMKGLVLRKILDEQKKEEDSTDDVVEIPR